VVETLQLPLLLLALLADSHEFIEQNRALLFSLGLFRVVLAQLRLQEVAHLGELSLALRLKALDKVGHLQIVFF